MKKHVGKRAQRALRCFANALAYDDPLTYAAKMGWTPAELRGLVAAMRESPADAGARETDPERLRLLEAVAEVARADARHQIDFMDGDGMSFAEYLVSWCGEQMNDNGLAMLEALAALEALDEQR